MSSTDRALLESYSLRPLTENSLGSHPVSSPTLFFLPHCPESLYSNLLKANWNPKTLSFITVIGNSFKNYDLRRLASSSSSLLSLSLPYIEETALDAPSTSSFFNAFTDQVLITWRTEELEKAPASFWQAAEKVGLRTDELLGDPTAAASEETTAEEDEDED